MNKTKRKINSVRTTKWMKRERRRRREKEEEEEERTKSIVFAVVLVSSGHHVSHQSHSCRKVKINNNNKNEYKGREGGRGKGEGGRIIYLRKGVDFDLVLQVVGKVLVQVGE